MWADRLLYSRRIEISARRSMLAGRPNDPLCTWLHSSKVAGSPQEHSDALGWVQKLLCCSDNKARELFQQITQLWSLSSDPFPAWSDHSHVIQSISWNFSLTLHQPTCNFIYMFRDRIQCRQHWIRLLCFGNARPYIRAVTNSLLIDTSL